MVALFKISEAAHKLNVETFVIFEKLLTHAELMKDHTEKIHSITYIDERGIDILKALIEGKTPDDISVLEESEEEVSIQDQDQDKDLDNLPAEKEETYKSESTPSEDEDWLTEDDLIILDDEKQKLRQEVSRLRQDLIQYDTDLRKMDEVIDNYHILIKEDVARLTQLESQMESLLFRQTIKNDNKPKEESSGMFGFIRK